MWGNERQPASSHSRQSLYKQYFPPDRLKMPRGLFSFLYLLLISQNCNMTQHQEIQSHCFSFYLQQTLFPAATAASNRRVYLNKHSSEVTGDINYYNVIVNLKAGWSRHKLCTLWYRSVTGMIWTRERKRKKRMTRFSLQSGSFKSV